MSESPVSFFSPRSKRCESRTVNYNRHRLTQSPTFHFFHFVGHDRKDIYYLDHNVDDHVRDSCGQFDPDVYLKSLKKTFDTVEDIDELVMTSAGIFSRLGGGRGSVKIECPVEP